MNSNYNIITGMNIENAICSSVISVVKGLYGQDVPEKMVQLQKTRSNFEGNLTLVVFPFLKISKKNPEQTAKEIGEALVKECSAVAAFNVVKGFLNLTVAKEAWIGLLNDINADEKFGEKKVTDNSPLVMIEYSSPNTNKPLHLGHVRNNLLGWSLAQIMEANGNKVVKTNIVNDRGIHICKSMLAWLKWGNGVTPEQAGKKGDHLIGDFYVAFDKHYRAECETLKAEYMQEGMDEEAAGEKAKAEAPLMKEAHEMLVKWEQGDKEVRSLWEKMNNWVYAGFDETYKALGVGFDKIYYESNTYLEGKKKVEEGLDKGLFFRKDDNSVWADLTNEGLDQKLLLRRDGTSVYMTQDIGTADMRFKDYPIDKMIYVVGNEHNYHFQVLSILLDRMPNGNREVPISDAEAAMRLVRANASSWHINRNDVGIMGSSAGGHLASVIATHSTGDAKPNFQILFYPVITMLNGYAHQHSHDNFLGKDATKKDEKEYSSDMQVTRVTPRAWIALSDDDKAVMPSNGVNYYLELYRHDVPASLHVYPSGGHGWGIRPNFKFHATMLQELKDWLLQK